MSAPTPMTKYANCTDDEQLALAEKLLADDPSNVPLLEWVAFLHYTSKNYDRAIELFLELTRLDPRNEGHMYYLANSYFHRDCLAVARTWWHKVIAANPAAKFAAKARNLLSIYEAVESAA